jgi:hypothetical protein
MQVMKMIKKSTKIIYILELFLILVSITAVVSAKDELYIIGYGTIPGSQEEESLKHFAQSNGGEYLNAVDFSTPDQLKSTLTTAFTGQVSPTVNATPVPPPAGESACDCVTYDPYYDEPTNCYLYGLGCSECYEACYEYEEDTGDESSAPCNCRTYDISDESMSCMESGRGCSDCFYLCN